MTAEDSFSIIHDSGKIDYPLSTLLVGIDETGHETFADANHPVFGLGGCAVLLRDYEHLIERPWQYMKQQFFSGPDQPLHAAELNKPTKKQMEALGYFFTHFSFFRFAVMVADTLENNTQFPLIQLVCNGIWGRIADIAKYVQPTQIVVVIEQSERIKKDVYGYLAGYKIGNDEIMIEPRLFFATKYKKQAFMEVADFVMHAAGAQVRNRILKKGIAIRKDFEVVFHKVDPRLTSYTELLKANNATQSVNPADPQSSAAD
ncbi:MAG: DUF3800 domain-containing protein [Desulfobacteraceae bacterium]|nr:DUF3800 domain-containing protein [Desulfobacteraceae bacterium]